MDAVSAERLGELKVPLTPRAASLRIAGDPATRVYVGGKLLGTAGGVPEGALPGSRPARRAEPLRGRESSSCSRRPAGAPPSATVRVRAGQEISVPAILTEEPPR